MPFKLTRCIFVVCLLVLCSMGTAQAEKFEKVQTPPDVEGFYSFVKMGDVAYFVSSGPSLASLKINADGSTDIKKIHSIKEYPDRLVSTGTSLFYLGEWDPLLVNVWHHELWKSDGTSAGPTLVKKVSHPDGYINGGLSVVGDSVYFEIGDLINGSKQLWKYDGLTDTVYTIKETAGGGHFSHVVGSDGTAYFLARRDTPCSDEGPWEELWKTDGSPGNATRVELPGEVVDELFIHDGKLCFGLRHNNRLELWVIDGSQAGARFIKAITLDQAGLEANDNPLMQYVGSAGSFMYFNAARGNDDSDWLLWKTDGTAGGTKVLRGAVADYHFVAPEVENSLFFEAYYRDTTEERIGVLRKTNGNGAGTFFIKNLAQKTSSGIRLGSVRFNKVFNNELYFTLTYIQPEIHEFWKTDGTEGGTLMLKRVGDRWIGRHFVVMGDSMFFGLEIEQGHFDLWRMSKSDPVDALPASLHLLLDNDK